MYLSSQRSGVTKRKHVVYFERFFLVLGLLCFLAAFIILCLLVGLNHKAKREPAAVVLFMEPMPGSLGALRFLAQRVDVTVEMVVLSTAAWGRDVNHAYDTVTRLLNAMRKEQTLRYDIPVYYGSIHEREGACRVSIDAVDLISPGALLKCRRTHELLPEARKMMATVFGAADVLGSTDPMFEHAKDNATGDAEDAGVEDRWSRSFEAPLLHYLRKKSASFLVLGAATDVARFLQQHSEQNDRVIRIVVAAGAVREVGNARHFYYVNNTAERNAFIDPKSMNYILGRGHGRPVSVLPLDASPRWEKSLYNALVVDRAAEPTPDTVPRSAAAVARALNSLYKFMNASTMFPFEMAAAAYLVDPRLHSGAKVVEGPLLVASGLSPVHDGLLGTTKKVGSKKMLNVQLVVKLHQSNFWKMVAAMEHVVV